MLWVSHPTWISRLWMRLLDEILAIWVSCNCKLYSDNPGGCGMGQPILWFWQSPTGPPHCTRTTGLQHAICGPSRSGFATRGCETYFCAWSLAHFLFIHYKAQHTIGETKDYLSNHHLDDLCKQFTSIFNVDLQIMVCCQWSLLTLWSDFANELTFLPCSAPRSSDFYESWGSAHQSSVKHWEELKKTGFPIDGVCWYNRLLI